MRFWFHVVPDCRQDLRNLHWEWSMEPVMEPVKRVVGVSKSFVCCNNPQPSTLRPISVETSPIFPGRNIRNKKQALWNGAEDAHVSDHEMSIQ